MGEFSVENVVRWAGIPQSRPVPRAATVNPVSAEDTDRSFFTITGTAGKVIELKHSKSANMSRHISQELERTFDTMRVKNPDDHDQHVDVEVMTRLKSINWAGVTEVQRLQKPQETDDIEKIDEGRKRADPSAYGKVFGAGGGGSSSP